MKRHGLSLLEVLVSVFILTFGLLSVVALIPVGTHNMLEANKLDRGAALARAAIRDVKTMGLLDRHRWCDAEMNSSTSKIADVGGWAIRRELTINYAALPQQPMVGQAFVLDPLQITHFCEVTDPGDPSMDDRVQLLKRFPFLPPGSQAQNTPFLPTLARLSLLDCFCVPNTRMDRQPAAVRTLNAEYYRRMFTCADDALLHTPEDASARPSQIFTLPGAGGFTTSHEIADPAAPPSGAAVPLVRESDGHYSWFLTATPSADQIPATAADLRKDFQRHYTVSVAVCYKRNLALDINADEEVPNERWASVETRGVSGGNARLYVPSSGSMARTASYLELKKNHWILLCGDIPGPPSLGFRRIAKWYRIVSLDREPTEETIGGRKYWTRYVTLDGPDWPLRSDPGSMTTYAYILDSVVAVHTTELEVED